MRLTAKILSWLLASIVLVMIMFTSLAIYMLQKNLKEEAYKSHKLIYSLFLPAITRYLWEFDITGIKETLTNIIENNYANKIFIYDSDSTLITYLYKDNSTGKISHIKENEKINDSDKIFTESDKNLLEKKSLNNEDFFIYKENSLNDSAKIISAMTHKKGLNTNSSIIGYFILNYSTDNITAATHSMIRGVIILAICITIMLVVTISFLLRKSLINSILKLSQASINITRGNFTKIEEPKRSKDEMVDLVKNFNIMIGQIEINQENLKLLAEEGIKISSKFDISEMAVQVSESLNKISKINIHTEFFVLNSFINNLNKDGYFDVLKPNSTNFIKLSEEEILPHNKKRFFIKDATGKICIIIQIDDLKNIPLHSFTVTESIYNTIRALQISISNGLDNIRFVADQKEQQRLISEQETARLVQNNLMPKFEYRKVGNFELANYFESAAECAGDWWNYYILPNNKLLLLLGDVTGHGTASALMTAVVKGFCDSIYIQPNITSKEILNQLNSVVRESGDGSKVMTMFAAVLDPHNGLIEFSNAAHNFPLMIKRKNNNKIVEKLIAQGKPLGFESPSKENQKINYYYDQKQAKIEKDDILFIFSDGLIEAINNSGEEFSEKRLKNLLQSLDENDINKMKDDIIKSLREFTSYRNFNDDVTFLICKLNAL